MFLSLLSSSSSSSVCFRRRNFTFLSSLSLSTNFVLFPLTVAVTTVLLLLSLLPSSSSSPFSLAQVNTTSTAVPSSVFANYDQLLRGAPFPVQNANISLTRSSFVNPFFAAHHNNSSSSSQQQQAAAPSSQYGTTLEVTLQIEPGTSDRLQWDRSTAQFAKFLAFSSPVVANSVFAPTRHLQYAPWSVVVSGVNDSVLTMYLHLGSCVDMPRRESEESVSSLNLDVNIPPSLTRPPLSGPLPLTHRAVFPQHEESSTSEARELIGTIFFALLFLIVLVLMFQFDSASGAMELLWTLQIMLIVADSPCSKQSFFSFSKHVFWILRWAVEPRSIVPALVHSIVLIVGLFISYLLGLRAKSPQQRLNHPRFGLFFVAILLLGGIHTNMSLMLGGVPDFDTSMDAGNRILGLILLLVILVGTILFCWSGTGSLSLRTMVVQPAVSSIPGIGKASSSSSSSTFFIGNIWKPVTMWRRNAPITGIYANLAYLPPSLNYLSNFLPFFISLMLNVITALLFSVDHNNIGGCLASMTLCIGISTLYFAHVFFGNNVCRSRAWTVFVSLLHIGRILWFFSAMIHLDCNGDATAVTMKSTVLAVVALVTILVAAVIAVLAAKAEAPLKSNRLKTKYLAKQKQGEILAESNELPTISISKADDELLMLGKENNNNNNNSTFKSKTMEAARKKINPLNLTQLGEDNNNSANIDLSVNNSFASNQSLPSSPVHGTNNSATATSPSSSSNTNGKQRKKNKSSSAVRKQLPPLSDGTGEKPQSPMFGGVQRKGLSTPGSPFESKATGNGGAENRNGGSNNTSPNLTGGCGGMSNNSMNNNNNNNDSFPTLSLRDRFLNLSDDSHNSSNNVHHHHHNQNTKMLMNPNSAAAILLANAQRPRGESVESRLSSGSGSVGHEGPGSRQRSPSGSFGKNGVPPSFCPRCGAPTRVGPQGMRQLCVTCKTLLLQQQQQNTTSSSSGSNQWELPTTTTTADTSANNFSLASSHPSGMNLLGNNNNNNTQSARPLLSFVGNNNNNSNNTLTTHLGDHELLPVSRTNSSRVSLPSYNPGTSNTAGIIQLPSYQTKASASAASKEDDDTDWL